MATAKKGGAQEGSQKGRRRRKAQRRDSLLSLRKTGVLCVRTRGWRPSPFSFLAKPKPPSPPHLVTDSLREWCRIISV